MFTASGSVAMYSFGKNSMGLLLLIFMAGHELCAQVAPSPEGAPGAQIIPAPPVATTNAKSDRAVDIFFVARTGSGRQGTPIQNLTQADCTLAVDGSLQRLRGFAPAAKVPLTLGMLLDTSVDQQRVLPMEQQAAAKFLRSDLQPGDEAFVVSFDVTVDLLADLTARPAILEGALQRAQINSASGHYANGTIPSIGRPKGALLYDAIYLAAQDELRHQGGRKVLVIMTEGRDDGSRKKLQQAMESAQRANAVVYVLFVSDPGIYGVLDESGNSAMRKLAQSTGGRFFHIGKDGRKLQAAFVEIEKELQSQYRMTFAPAGAASHTGYDRLEIACSEHGKPMHVQAPSGYYAIGPR
jgi:VWFA-related protein